MSEKNPKYESCATEASVIADLAMRTAEHDHVDLGEGVRFVVLPDGKRLESIKRFYDEARGRPERRAGEATFTDLDSFIAHTKRFADKHSAIFAQPNGQAPTMTSVLDYHEGGPAGLPRFGEHRGVYSFPLSKPWAAWTGKSGNGMNQAAFAEFLEDHLVDVLDPAKAGEVATVLAQTLGVSFATPAKLLELSRGLAIRVGSTIKNAANLSTGEMQIQYETTHADERGAPIKIPGAFVVALSVFQNGAPYQLPVRLRYRLKNGEVFWFFELYRADAVFDHAFKEACDKAAAETGLPLFIGSPE